MKQIPAIKEVDHLRFRSLLGGLLDGEVIHTTWNQAVSSSGRDIRGQTGRMASSVEADTKSRVKQ